MIYNAKELVRLDNGDLYVGPDGKGFPSARARIYVPTLSLGKGHYRWAAFGLAYGADTTKGTLECMALGPGNQMLVVQGQIPRFTVKTSFVVVDQMDETKIFDKHIGPGVVEPTMEDLNDTQKVVVDIKADMTEQETE